jgi:retron-type reverse transcriptase
MGNLLQRAASPEFVNAAWRRSKKDRAPWAAGIDRDEMERNIGLHLVRLSQELAAGDYAPDPVRYMPVHKGDGSRRIISAITLRDKVAQRAVLKVVEPLAEKTFHPDSYAYRPGRTIGMAAARAREYILCGMGWVVDAVLDRC